LLRAVPLVQRRIANVKMLIVGDGPERGALEALSQQLEVQNAVRFLGYMTREKLTPYYQQATVFVIPSLNEPQGIVIQEAMACGLPVVGSAVGGIPEMVRDGHNGLLVPPRDPQALAEAIIRILSNAALREHFSESALRTVQGFSWQQSIHKFLNLYTSLMKG
jgi:glycosyltransferase involved in cell wall biosynthesis